jgi:hypothetical protein
MRLFIIFQSVKHTMFVHTVAAVSLNSAWFVTVMWEEMELT